MKVVRVTDSNEAPATQAIFEGTVHARPLLGAESQVTATMVRFIAGGKNKPHTHSADQLLFVVEGHGIVATRDEEQHVLAGDIVHIPAGEVHWHGAAPGAHMAHLAIMPAGQVTEIVD